MSAASQAGGMLKGLGAGLSTFFDLHPIMAAVTAATALIAIVDHFTDTYDELKDKANASSEAYNSTKQEITSLNSELESTQSRINELSMKKGLTIVEEQELSNLQSTNEHLQQQLKIKEKLAKIQQETAARDAAATLREESPVGTRYAENGMEELGTFGKETLIERIEREQKELDNINQKYDEQLKLVNKMQKKGEDPSAGTGLFGLGESANDVLETYAKAQKDLTESISSDYTDLYELSSSLYDDNGNVLNGQQSLVDKINSLYDTIPDHTDQATKKAQEDFDKLNSLIDNNSILSEEKNNLLKKAKENSGITDNDLSQIVKSALTSSGIEFQEFVDQINSEAGIIDLDKVRQKFKDAFQEPLLSSGDATAQAKAVHNELADSLSDEELTAYYNLSLVADTTKMTDSELLDAIHSMQTEAQDELDSNPITLSSILNDPNDDTVTKSIDNFQSDISTLKSTMDSIKSGDFKNTDITDLVQQFPELADQTDNLSEAISNLQADKLRSTLNAIDKKVADEGLTDPDQLTAVKKLKQGLIDAVDLTSISKDKLKSGISEMFSSLTDEDVLRFSGGADKMADNILSEFTKELGNADSREILYKLSLDSDSANWTLAQWRTNYEQALTQSKFSYDALKTSIDNAVTAQDNLNAAMASSVKGTGLTMDQITNVKNAYSELKDETGKPLFDNLEFSDQVFERTANGIHLNTTAMRELQKTQEETTKGKFVEAINRQQRALQTAQLELQRAKNGVKGYNEETAQAKVDGLEKQLNNLKLLQSQYEGMTSAYQKYLTAQSGGEEGDMYDSFQNIIKRGDELLKGGLVGTNEFRAIADLFSYGDQSSASVQELVQAYNDASPVIKKFFTDGEEGAHKFYDYLKENNFASTFTDENGIDQIKFNVGSTDQLAKMLGIDQEAVEAIFRKLSDYGYEIDLGNSTETLSEMADSATDAQEKLNTLTGKKYKFDFESTDLDTVNKQLSEAEKQLQQFRSSDGSYNYSANGAAEAAQVYETSLRQQQVAQQGDIFGVDSTAATEAAKPVLEAAQKFVQAKDELDVQTQMSTQGMASNVTEMAQSTTDAFNTLKSMAADGNNPLGIDFTKITNADQLEEFLQGLSSEEIELKAGINTSEAEEDIERLKGGAEGSTVEIIADVTTEGGKESLRQSLASITEGASANVVVSVTNEDDVDNLITSLQEVPPDTPVSVTVTAENQEQLDKLNAGVANLENHENIQINAKLNQVNSDGESKSVDVVGNVTEFTGLDNIDPVDVVANVTEFTGLDKADPVDVVANVTKFEGLDKAGDVPVNVVPNPSEIEVSAKDANVNVTFDEGQVAQISETIEGIPDGDASVNLDIQPAEDNVGTITGEINGIPGASPVVSITNYASGVISSISSQLSSLNGRRAVTVVETRHVTTGSSKGGYSSHTGDFATGTMLSPAKASGTAYNVINTKPINSYAGGKVSLPHDETALVNEVGQESLIFILF